MYVSDSESSRENEANGEDSGELNGPILIADGIYTREQIRAIFTASNRVYYQWVDDGLKVLDTGTDRRFLYGRDVIAFFDNKGPRPKRSRKKAGNNKPTNRKPKGES